MSSLLLKCLLRLSSLTSSVMTSNCGFSTSELPFSTCSREGAFSMAAVTVDDVVIVVGVDTQSLGTKVERNRESCYEVEDCCMYRLWTRSDRAGPSGNSRIRIERVSFRGRHSTDVALRLQHFSKWGLLIMMHISLVRLRGTPQSWVAMRYDRLRGSPGQVAGSLAMCLTSSRALSVVTFSNSSGISTSYRHLRSCKM